MPRCKIPLTPTNRPQVGTDVKPDRLNAAFKTRPLELYEAEVLLSVAVNEIAGGDDEVSGNVPRDNVSHDEAYDAH